MGTSAAHRTQLQTQGDWTRGSILWALGHIRERDGRPPTIREIAALTGIPSTGTISYHLSRLVQEGKVVNIGGSRGYTVVTQ